MPELRRNVAGPETFARKTNNLIAGAWAACTVQWTGPVSRDAATGRPGGPDVSRDVIVVCVGMGGDGGGTHAAFSKLGDGFAAVR